MAGKTTERLTGRTGESGVVDVGQRIVAVNSDRFRRDFIENLIVPIRREVAMNAIAAHIQREGLDEENIDELIRMAFDLGDRFALAAVPTLEKRLPEYFRQYMQRGKIDEILETAMDEAKDYSLP